MKKFFALVSLFLTLLACGCDLSHKHYYNDRGVCNCGDDIAEKLTYLNEEYVSNEHNIEEGKVYYYKFDANGEEGIDFYLESEDVTFDRIEIRADGILQTTAGNKNYDYKVFTYDRQSFTKDRTYFLKVTYKGQGTVKLVLKEAV